VLYALVWLSGTLNAADPYGKAESDPYGKSELLAAGVEWSDKSLSIGSPVTVGGVTIYPVIDEDAPKHTVEEALGLSVAMSSGQLAVREADSEGYTAVQMVNYSKQPVYVMAGEVIRGGRQDRMITEDVMVPPDHPLMVQVHCVEKGRWSDAPATFTYDGRAEFALRDVLDKGGDQEATWSMVASLNTARNAAANGAYVAADGPEWLAYRQQLRAQLADDDQIVGAVIAHNGQLVHAEMFGDPSLAAIGRAVALDGYARDAVVMSDITNELPDTERVEAFLYSYVE
jgi:hypothetical protein